MTRMVKKAMNQTIKMIIITTRTINKVMEASNQHTDKLLPMANHMPMASQSNLSTLRMAIIWGKGKSL
jgi:hypothetical protein